MSSENPSRPLEVISRLTRAGAVALLLGVLSPSASAQTVDQLFFEVLGAGPGVEDSCGFRVRAELAGSLTRRGYRVRLPNWQFTVSSIPGTGVTNAAVDQTMNAAASLLQTDQGGTDVNCCVDIRRSGGVGSFNPPASMAMTGVITTQAEQNAVFAVNADIKIVNGITWCNQAGSYVGCAIGGTQIVVNTFNPPTTNVFTNPWTVAHETGHLAGLCHVGQNCAPTCGQSGTCSGCTDPSANNVMYYRVCAGAPNQGVINGAECSSYQASAGP